MSAQTSTAHAGSSRLQLAAGTLLRAKVAGENAEARAKEIWGTTGPRWFKPGDPIWRVHDDAAMFPAGVTALLVQMLHPKAMAGVGDFSGYQDDPWGRLQRTADYIAMTTFGTIGDAEDIIARVRRIHDRVRGTDEFGDPYWGSDPDLLLWVHDAEIDSFLRAYQAYHPSPLTASEADHYVAQTAVSARLLGVEDAPTTVAELRGQLRDFRPQLRVTNSARAAVRFLLSHPPVSGAATIGYGLIATGGVALLPGFAREMLGIRVSTRVAHNVGRPLGVGTTRLIRWALAGVDKTKRMAPQL